MKLIITIQYNPRHAEGEHIVFYRGKDDLVSRYLCVISKIDSPLSCWYKSHGNDGYSVGSHDEEDIVNALKSHFVSAWENLCFDAGDVKFIDKRKRNKNNHE